MLFFNHFYVFLYRDLEKLPHTCNQCLELYELLLESVQMIAINPCLDQLWKFISGKCILAVKTSKCLHHRTNINNRKANISVGCAHTRSECYRTQVQGKTLRPSLFFDTERKFILFITQCQNLICGTHLTWIGFYLSYYRQTEAHS